MHPRDQLILDLAHSMNHVEDFTAAFPDDRAAAQHFFQLVHDSRCPGCASEACHLVDPRHVRCQACRKTRSLTSTTPLRNTKLTLRLWLAAVWHMLVDTDHCTARGFGRRYALRRMTAWDLLHVIRRAAPIITPVEGGVTGQVLGHQSPSNTAFVTVATDGGYLSLLPAGRWPSGTGPTSPHVALWLGRLRAWIADIYRGVKKEYLVNYLAEFTHRFARKLCRQALLHDPPLLPRWDGPDP